MAVQYRIVPPCMVMWAGFVDLPGKAGQNLPKKRKRFYFLEGGRGSGKSMGVADFLIERARTETCRILCGREVQKSIKESVYELIMERIKAHGLDGEFDHTLNEINHKASGSSFIFVGLRDHTSDSVKSYQNIKYAWLEEAQTLSKKSLKILVPTIRADGSSLFFTYNRYVESDPVHELRKREIQAAPEKMKMTYKGIGVMEWHQAESEDAVFVHMDYDSNPFFPDVLRAEMEKEKKESYDSYLHIWKGLPIAQTADSVISREEVEEAANREIEAEGGVVVGVDVARFGDDKSKFVMRKGMKVTKTESHAKIDTQKLTDYLEDFVDKRKDTKIQVDDSGIGGAVTDALRARGYTCVVPILNNQAPKDPERYDMAISEMWFDFRSIINEVQIPNDAELKEELSERKYSFDKKQRRSIEPKRDFKKRIGRSPDSSDATLLAFYRSSSGGVVLEDFSSNDIEYIYESRRR